MPLKRRVVEVKGEPTQVRFCLESPDLSSSIIDFAAFRQLTSPEVASESQEEDRERELRTLFREAQVAMTEGDLKLSHRHCIDLINAPDLPIDLKIETIQVMATLVPLDQARYYLEDALRIADDKFKEEPEDLLWFGLQTTTRDMLWKIHKLKGAIKFHREITFGDPYAAARDRDMRKGGLLVKKQVHFQDEVTHMQTGDPVKRTVRVQDEIAQMQLYDRNRPLRTSSCPKTLYRPLKHHESVKGLLPPQDLAPKYACAQYL